MTTKLPLAKREDVFESMLTESTQVEKKRKKGRNILELVESVCSFEELPTDIRLKIWNLALPGPRLVEMVSYPHPRMNSNRSTPSILHVCSESRKEALKSYTAFPLGLAPDPFRAVYVNFQIDTLYFRVGPNGSMPKVLRYGLEIEHLMNNVRFVAIKHDSWEATGGGDSQAMPFLQRFGELEKLTLVVSDVGPVEITDDYELDVWDEWQIDERSYGFDCNVWDKFAVIFRGSKSRIGETDRGHLEFDVISRRCKMRMLTTNGFILKLMKRAVMTRDCLGLKNIQARIVTIERGVKAS